MNQAEIREIDPKLFPKELRHAKYAPMMAEYLSMIRHPRFLRSGHQVIKEIATVGVEAEEEKKPDDKNPESKSKKNLSTYRIK